MSSASGVGINPGSKLRGAGVRTIALREGGLEIGGDMVRVFGDFLDSVWWSVVLEVVIEDVVVGGV